MTAPAQLPISWCPPPRARATDPETSRMAAWEVTRDGSADDQALFVLRVACRWPGSTSRELASFWAEFVRGDWKDYRWMIGRRLSELEANGLVTCHRDEDGNGTKRVCEYTGKMALVWWPTAAGRRVVEGVS